MNVQGWIKKRKEERRQDRTHHENVRLSRASVKMEELKKRRKVLVAEEAVRKEKQAQRELTTRKYREGFSALKKGVEKVGSYRHKISQKASSSKKRVKTNKKEYNPYDISQEKKDGYDPYRVKRTI